MVNDRGLLCEKNQTKMLNKVKEYLLEHEDADIIEVSAKCYVTFKQLRQWVNEGYLDL